MQIPRQSAHTRVREKFANLSEKYKSFIERSIPIPSTTTKIFFGFIFGVTSLLVTYNGGNDLQNERKPASEANRRPVDSMPSDPRQRFFVPDTIVLPDSVGKKLDEQMKEFKKFFDDMETKSRQAKIMRGIKNI